MTKSALQKRNPFFRIVWNISVPRMYNLRPCIMYWRHCRDIHVTRPLTHQTKPSFCEGLLWGNSIFIGYVLRNAYHVVTRRGCQIAILILYMRENVVCSLYINKYKASKDECSQRYYNLLYNFKWFAFSTSFWYFPMSSDTLRYSVNDAMRPLRCTIVFYHGPHTWYVKSRVAHAPGMPGTFPRHRWLAIPTCITARA